MSSKGLCILAIKYEFYTEDKPLGLQRTISHVQIYGHTHVLAVYVLCSDDNTK